MPKPVYWAASDGSKEILYTSNLVPEYAVCLQIGATVIAIDYGKKYYVDANDVQHVLPALHYAVLPWCHHRLCFRDQHGHVVGYIEGCVVYKAPD